MTWALSQELSVNHPLQPPQKPCEVGMDTVPLPVKELGGEVQDFALSPAVGGNETG